MAHAPTHHPHGSRVIAAWPEESRETAQLVIEQYGQPDEATASHLIWHHPGPWKRIVATKAFCTGTLGSFEPRSCLALGTAIRSFGLAYRMLSTSSKRGDD